MRALVIEDDARVRDLVTLQLRGRGYATFDAGTVGAALEVLDADMDLVVLDLHLPNGHGAQVLRSIAETREDVPVVVITGYPEDWPELADVHPLAWMVAKPWSATQFHAAVSAAARAREDIQKLRAGTRRMSELISRRGGNG